ncbi:hypothetical protein GJ496_006632 [Pomphorhynchus laevis]|nr:hypothetical protein GJ496_006632 [Pomphorhynchus laevis]
MSSHEYSIVDVPSSLNEFSYRYKIFDFEQKFFNMSYILEVHDWMRLNWINSVFGGIMYVIFAFVCERVMKNRQAMNLQPILILWNICFAAFSCFGFIRVLPEFIYSLTVEGFEYSICNNSNAYGVAGFWSYMFCLSKVPELFDTAFIVLRKRPLIFLHWFHHSTVLIYTWLSYENLAASGRWFMTINYGIHSVMYTYYACKALKWRVPEFLSVTITAFQILQMCMGCYVNYNILKIKRDGRLCRVPNINVYVSFFIYFLYFLLFTHFFVCRYFVSKPTTSSKKPLSNKKTDSCSPDDDTDVVCDENTEHEKTTKTIRKRLEANGFVDKPSYTKTLSCLNNDFNDDNNIGGLNHSSAISSSEAAKSGNNHFVSNSQNRSEVTSSEHGNNHDEKHVLRKRVKH